MNSFGSILTLLLRDRDISASELAKRMGMRSKTSLLRILKDQSGYETVLRFWEQLCQSDLLALSECEKKQLSESLEMLRVGAAVYRTNHALQALLLGQRPADAPITVHGLAGIADFEDLCRRYSAAEQLEITLIGLCDLRIFRTFQQMCCSMPAHRQPQIRHYIFTIADASSTIRTVCAISPILFQRNYIVRMIPMKQADTDMHFPGEMMLCRFTDSSSQTHYHQLAFAGHSAMHAIAYPDGAAYDYWHSLISANDTDLQPLKAVFSEEHTADDYYSFIENIRLLEKDSNVYMIKPDIPISVVPAQILYQAVADNSTKADFLPDDQLQQLLEPLYQSHEKRHNHLFHRRRVTHMILSRSAMLEFARTGMQSDHFYGARPYTPQERAQILQLCLDASLSDPYFNIHFAASEDLKPDTEITQYEGKGTVLLNAHTSYHLADDHSEAMITHDGFNSQLRQYFVGELLRSHVLPAAETHAFLRSLIRVALESE